MNLNQFSARVVGGHEVAGGYVEMSHGQTYSLRLHNYHPRRCDATVSIDGKPIGTFRIAPNSSIVLERPQNDQGKFTFYKSDSPEGKLAEGIGESDRGLVTVTFVLEKAMPTTTIVHRYIPYFPRRYWSGWSYDYWYDGSIDVTYLSNHYDDSPQTSCYFASLVADSVSAGAQATSEATPGFTGLSGHSDQEFYQVPEFAKDESTTTVINLRLVCKEVSEPRPLVGISSPVPPPLK
jgi:phage terminase large subunit-like protein